MALLRNLAAGLRALFGKRRADQEMDDELSAFLDAAVKEKMRAGMSHPAALRAARVEMGSTEGVKEGIRAAGWESSVETFWQDLRYAARMFRKNPAFTAVAVLTLALGIGANAAIFSLIDAVVLRLLPVQRPEELVQIGMRSPGEVDRVHNSFTNTLWEQLRDRQDAFSGTFAWSNDQFDLAQGGAVRYADGLWVSGGFFGMLGLRTAAGRLLAAADDQRGCPGAAVLSYGFWQSHYGGAESVIDSTISLDRHSFQVIGVAPAGFFGMDVGQKFDVAIPICAAAIFDRDDPSFPADAGVKSRLDERSWWWLKVAGRLQPGVTADQAKARLAVLSPQVMAAALPGNWPAKNQQDFLKRTLANAPGATGTSNLRRQFQQPLNILMGVVGLVLLIACANIASLMLARATTRTKEFAVRRALGASRMRLVRQLLTECVLLSAAGALVGLLFARWGAALLVRHITQRQTPVFLDLSLDGRVLGFTAAVAVLTGIFFGVLPALRSARVSLTAAMQGAGTAAHGGRARFGAGKTIVASQVALSLVLLVASGLFLRSFEKLITLDLGFDRSNVLLVRANLTAAKLPDQQYGTAVDDIEARLRAIPGVVSAARSRITPISGMEWNQYIRSDAPNPPQGEASLVYFNSVSPGYFETLRTPILAGRNLDAHDTETSPRVAVINQTLARIFFPGLSPVGRTFRKQEIGGEYGPPIEVVGVAKDSKYESLREDTFATAFFPVRQVSGEHQENFELRTAVPPSSLTGPVRDAVASINKDISLDFHTLAQQVDDSLVQDRLLAMLSSFFGALALLLAMIGLYGALSYTVTQRRKEFGVRMALGAGPGSILRLVIRDVASIVAAGVLTGIAISLAATRLLQKMLFGLDARDTLTLAAAVAVLSAVAFFAGYLPARRATKLNPMVVLRTE
jgi:putative ABC transport system permease protein